MLGSFITLWLKMLAMYLCLKEIKLLFDLMHEPYDLANKPKQ